MKESFEQTFLRYMEGKPKPKPKKMYIAEAAPLPGFDALCKAAQEEQFREPPLWAILLFAFLDLATSVGDSTLQEYLQPEEEKESAEPWH